MLDIFLIKYFPKHVHSTYFVRSITVNKISYAHLVTGVVISDLFVLNSFQKIWVNFLLMWFLCI